MDRIKVYKEYRKCSSCVSGYFKKYEYVKDLINNSLIYVLAEISNGRHKNILHTSSEIEIINYAEKLICLQRNKNLSEVNLVVNVVDEKFNGSFLDYDDFKLLIIDKIDKDKERE